MKRFLKIIVLIILVASVTSCADTQVVTECTTGDTAGFLGGLWNGITAPFSWFGSLFNSDIAIYNVNNNGGWYDFGFILGIGGLSSGATKSSSK